MAQHIERPADYFDYFNQQHTAIVQKNMEYLQHAVHTDDLTQVARKRLDLILQIEETAMQTEKLPRSDNDAGMRQAMLDVLNSYRGIFKVDFQQVEALKAESQDNYAAMERYLAAQDAAEKKMAEASDRFLEAQRAFAKANNITLMEGAQNSEIEQINRLNRYQRAIFLRSFRVGKRNAEFLSALDRKEVKAMAEARRLLLQEAQQELTSLRRLPDFNGNTAYRDAAVQQVEGILALATEDYPALITVTSKEEDKLTPADIEAYNLAVTHLNERINPAAEAVNNALNELLRQNVPKPATKGVKRI